MPMKSLSSRLSKHKKLDGGAAKAIPIMEAAARLRIGRTNMQHLIRDRKVRSVKIGRQVRVIVESLDEYLADLEKKHDDAST